MADDPMSHAPGQPSAPGTTSLPVEEPESELGARERKKRQTRLALHGAALDLVTARGLTAVTTDDIARAAGVSPRTFFNYFPTKEAALTGVAEVLVERIAELVADRPAEEPQWETCRLVAQTLCHVTTRDEEMWRRRAQLVANRPEVAPLLYGVERTLEVGVVDALVARAESAVTPGPPWQPRMQALAAVNAVRVASEVGDDPAEVHRVLTEILDRLERAHA
ncbi:TetR/AcrR family transcriptional regulator [Luteococcus sp. Sow4_B9]|uniref:TetR/AcrR family transcriptional regulator n=1 Tax=Luteococcus sp. Sow4_B9 TaxID=3438792 RepID=UPI003F9D2F73